MVCPQYIEKLFSPPAFSFIQSGPEILENSSICHRHFPIYLRMANGCELMLDVQAGTELFEGLIVELLIVFDDDDMGKSKLVDN